MSENPARMKFFVLIVVFILILAFSLCWYFFGGVGMLKFILYFMIVVAILTILFLVVYAVFWLFKILPIDAVHVNKERILKACKANMPPTPIQLFFKGNEEWEYKLIGFITGVCRIAHRVRVNDLDAEGKTQKLVDPNDKNKFLIKTKIVEFDEDCLSFRKSLGFFSRLFGKDTVVRVLRSERTSLNADKVFLKSMSFTPEKFGFFFLPNRWRDETLRKTLASEVHDVTLQEILKQEVNIVDDAIAISPRHQKELEKTNMQQLQGGGSTNQGGGGGGG